MADSTDRALTVSNGEGYRFRAVDIGIEGLKIELYDSRELDLLDKDRIHAVLLKPSVVRELLIFMRMNW